MPLGGKRSKRELYSTTLNPKAKKEEMVRDRKKKEGKMGELCPRNAAGFPQRLSSLSPPCTEKRGTKRDKPATNGKKAV